MKYLLAVLAGMLLCGCTYMRTISPGYGYEQDYVTVDMHRSVNMSYEFDRRSVMEGETVMMSIVFHNFSDSPVTFHPMAQYAFLPQVERNKEVRGEPSDDVFRRNPVITLGPTAITVPARGNYRTAVHIIPGFDNVFPKPQSYTLILRTVPPQGDGTRQLFYSTNKDYVDIRPNPDIQRR